MAKWYLAALFALVGCSSGPTPVLSPYTLTIATDATVNASENNSANPVVVRLYQLTDVQLFKQLPFIDLYEQDLELLSANLVSKQVLPIVLPNSKTEHTIDVNQTTQYIAVLVEFVDYQNGVTKAFSTLPAEDEQFLQLNIEGVNASLNVITPESSWWQVF